MLAKHALSQLSYGPEEMMRTACMVGLGRLERPTSPLSGVRSNHLSYRPETPRPEVGRVRALSLKVARLSRVGKRNEDGGVPHCGLMTEPNDPRRSDTGCPAANCRAVRDDP